MYLALIIIESEILAKDNINEIIYHLTQAKKNHDLNDKFKIIVYDNFASVYSACN